MSVDTSTVIAVPALFIIVGAQIAVAFIQRKNNGNGSKIEEERHKLIVENQRRCFECIQELEKSANREVILLELIERNTRFRGATEDASDSD